jgi:hypothetical protein
VAAHKGRQAVHEKARADIEQRITRRTQTQRDGHEGVTPRHPCQRRN